jgi:predicted Rossmann fold flavoprotein
VTEPDFDIAIIGAGAAGLMAAICAGRACRPASSGGPPPRIAALDSTAHPGAKVLISGGGRCNLTHNTVEPRDFSGSSPRAIARILRSFTVAQTVDFFADLGVTLKTEPTGKLFPITDDARTVLAALIRGVAQAGAVVRGGCRVTSVVCEDGSFALGTTSDTLLARRVILATGGKSLPKTGSDGSGYQLAQMLGHTVSPLWPALVPLVLPDAHWLTRLTGVSVEAVLAVRSGTGRVLHRQRGAMLCTHFGLSGPAVMDISRHWIVARAADPATALTANLLGGAEFAEVERRLLATGTRNPRATAGATLAATLPQRFAAELCRSAAGIDPAGPLTQLTREQRRDLVHALTALPLPVVRDRGYLFAEVTAGGVPLDEIDPATMASRRCPGLYLCGEILDADGRIGGYNFQWAWCTGRLAGMHAAQSLGK